MDWPVSFLTRFHPGYSILALLGMHTWQRWKQKQKDGPDIEQWNKVQPV